MTVAPGAARILVVEDRDSLRRMIERALVGEGYRVDSTADGESGMVRLDDAPYDLVLTDLKLPNASGLDVLRHARIAQPTTPVVVLTAFGTVGTAVEAMKAGAADFLEKPVELDDLFELVAGVLGEPSEVEPFQAGPDAPLIVGRHPRLRAALRLLEKVAPTDATVLLTGESGTGKELFARSVHALSPRRSGPFVTVNCAAIPDALLESELFGHEKGAFTGAHRAQVGRFERAERGTLLLDEVGELGPAVQAKVLRVLEDRVYERVGGQAPRTADVRLVAATNRDLGAMVGTGEFRSDLFFRLEVFPILLPPLRERPSDIAPLVRHLLGETSARHGVDPPRPTAEALARLAKAPWPGNVRQLANLLERAAILHHGEELRGDSIEQLLGGDSDRDGREQVRRALAEADGDKRRAAELLGVSYRTLCRRVREHDLEGYPRYRKQ